jgi:hypothetical protein
VDLSEKPSFWKALKPPAKDKCGELLTSLCYHPSNSILTLTLLKARNLKAKDINGKSGTFAPTCVCVYLCLFIKITKFLIRIQFTNM